VAFHLMKTPDGARGRYLALASEPQKRRRPLPMSSKKRALIDPGPCEGGDGMSEDQPGDSTLPKGGGDPPKRSRDEDAEHTAKASGGATPAQQHSWATLGASMPSTTSR
jgi:hypothetical protein